MQVVDLAECRELLKVLDSLRAQVLSGNLMGVSVCTKDRADNEIVTFAGSYLSDPESALRVAMKVSWDLTSRADHKAHLLAAG